MNKTAAEYNKRGKELYRLHKYDEAAQAFSTGIAYDPKSPSLRYNLAATSFKQGDYETARKEAELALAISPNHEKAQDIINALKTIEFTDELEMS